MIRRATATRRSCASACVAIGLFLICRATQAQETLCAEVKIEIAQELTLERQAFDARMRITNALDTLELQDLEIAIEFYDGGELVAATTNPNDLQAAFFIRRDQQENVELTEAGTGDPVWMGGTIGTRTSAEIRWLIIPAPGAAGDLLDGKSYEIGARVRYRLGGEPQEIVVAPDFITVRPQPQLQLDYFLTREVRANDPLTPEIEPSEPFTLGVRVLNNGYGVARNLAIDSAQPRIVENRQGLVISFEITGSFVGDEPALPTLQLPFGDIGPQLAKVGRWVMQTTLAGRFTEFAASFTHRDELGGRLTSLITEANAHFLIKDVVVDLPGRDRVADFLAFDEGTIATALKRVYESDTVDTVVSDQSDASSLTLLRRDTDATVYRLSAPVTAGMLYVRLPDPEGGDLVVERVVRADGKILPSPNGWVSAEGLGDETEYFVNLFDANGGGSYDVVLVPKSRVPQPPTVLCVPAGTTTEGNGQIGFVLQATDPNGDAVTWSAGALPIGAIFADEGGGQAALHWFPAVGQAGVYPISLRASDGALTSTCSSVLTVNPVDDADGDGMPDPWEIENFGDTSRDGSGDFDGDGISDLAEYRNGSDPTSPEGGPPAPIIASPLWDREVRSVRPPLDVRRPSSAAGFPNVTYEYQVFEDGNLDAAVAARSGVPEGLVRTSWTVDADLAEDRTYLWRVRTLNQGLTASSAWVYGRFRVNQSNVAPSAPRLSFPADGDDVDDPTPRLELIHATDPDGDSLTYGFDVSLDADGLVPVVSVVGVKPGYRGTTSWSVSRSLEAGTTYYWQATATDPHGASSQSARASFTVDPANQGPGVPASLDPTSGVAMSGPDVELRIGNAEDPEGDPLTLEIEVDRSPKFDGADLVRLGPIPQVPGETRVSISDLEENATYHWRARASDGRSHSRWRTTSFRVDAQDDPPMTAQLENPAPGAVMKTVVPRLEVFQAFDPDGERPSYEWEVFEDEALEIRIASGATPVPAWYVEPSLSSGETYYWRARTKDADGSYSAWLPAPAFSIFDDATLDPPTIAIQEPESDVVVPSGGSVRIRWTDEDPDSNASITLLANDTVIVRELAEDPDRESDVLDWRLLGIPPGTYRLWATISDGNTTSQGAGCCTITVTPAAQCSDGFDNDGDGGIDHPGDSACTGPGDPSEVLGDLDGDWDVDSNDLDILTSAMATSQGDPMFRPEADLDGDGVIGPADEQRWQAARDAARSRRACGAGPEIVPVLLGFWWFWRRQARPQEGPPGRVRVD